PHAVTLRRAARAPGPWPGASTRRPGPVPHKLQVTGPGPDRPPPCRPMRAPVQGGAMREYSTPAVVEVPASARLTDIVFERAENNPGLVILRRKRGPASSRTRHGDRQTLWPDVTAREFGDEVGALAKGFMAAGIGEGDRVGLMSRTRYEWTVLDYALWAAGAVPVPVYETSSAEQVEWILSNSGARAVVVETRTHLEVVTEVLRRLPDVQRVWVIDADPPTAAGGPGGVASPAPARPLGERGAGGPAAGATAPTATRG